MEYLIDLIPPPNYEPTRKISSAILRMILKGEKGAVHFSLQTGWYSPEVQKIFLDAINGGQLLCEDVFVPTPFTVGFHSFTPLYDEQTPLGSICAFLGVPCYYDANYFLAEKCYNALINNGFDGVWKLLEGAYYSKLDK